MKKKEMKLFQNQKNRTARETHVLFNYGGQNVSVLVRWVARGYLAELPDHGRVVLQWQVRLCVCIGMCVPIVVVVADVQQDHSHTNAVVQLSLIHILEARGGFPIVTLSGLLASN